MVMSSWAARGEETLPELGAQLASNEGCIWPLGQISVVVIWPLFRDNVFFCINAPGEQPDFEGGAFPPSKLDDRGCFCHFLV